MDKPDRVDLEQTQRGTAGEVVEQLDRLIHAGQRIQRDPVAPAAFCKWSRDVLETLATCDPSREAFSQRCNTLQPAHVRNGLDVLQSAKAAFALDRCRTL